MSDPQLLTGREPARALRAELQARVAALSRPDDPLSLAILRCDEDEAAAGYTRQILRSCKRVGVVGREVLVSADATTREVVARLIQLAAAGDIHGMLVAFPLPETVDPLVVTAAIPPAKDVDRVTQTGMGELFAGVSRLAPATAAAVDHLLDFYGVPLQGRRAVVIGRSNIVGKPVAVLLLARHATVTICHSRTADLPAVSASGDVLVVAVGRKHMIDEHYVKSGAVVIDVGTNYEDGGVFGDVDFAAVAPHVSAITPVPGGVGPLTNYCLIRNLVTLVERARKGSGETG